MGVGLDLAGRAKDGTEFPVEVSLSYSRGATLAIAFITDIRAWKRAEHDRFFALAPDSMCIVSADGTLKQVNPALQQCLGYTAEEMTGKRYWEFVHPDDRTAAQEAERALHQGNELREYRNRWIAKDGSVRWLEWTSRAVDGSDLVIYAAARDITATILLEGEQVELMAQRRTDEERLRALTAQLLTVQEDERRRIARELHDGPTQDLALLSAELGFLQKATGGEHQKNLAALRERVGAISEDVRQLAHQFHPSVLEHSGLVAALDAYCRDASRHGGPPVWFRAEQCVETHEITGPVAVTLYRIAQEALHNVTKHSGATSATVTLASVELSGGKRGLRLAIMDDGKGFLIEQVRNGSGLGLVSIEERARLVQGTFRISSVPGEGTRVEVEVPLPEAEA